MPKNLFNTIFPFLILLTICANTLADDCVLLLHGLARSNTSMSKLQKALEKEGFDVVNIHYPSRKHPIEKLSEDSIPPALAKCPKSSKVHFVTHSMGGILVRQYLSQHKMANLGHVVMLGPPNKGSQVVDNLTNFPGFKIINGPAGLQLGTSEMSVPNKLGAANFSLGIIAGTRSFNLVLSTMLPNPDDGKVSVENTKLEGMKDHITMPVTHTFMMRNKKVIDQVLYFLREGRFKQDKPTNS